MNQTALFPRLAFASTALALLLVSLNSGAVGTRRFVLRDSKDFEGGDIKGVAIDSTGEVRAGFDLGSTPVSGANTVFSALLRKDGSLLLGTGNEGKILRFDGAKTSVVAETKALAVTSLVEAWGGAVIVGTLPEGKLFKWDHDKLTEFAKLDKTEHIWQLAYDSKTNSVLAATGPEGKLYRIAANGTAQVYFDAEEQHLMSVAVAPDGTVYAGASDKAKLYKITGPGRATVLYDFARTEVRGIAVSPKGEVYAIANELTGGLNVPSRKSGSSDSPAGPTSPASKTKGQGTLYYFSSDGTPELLLEDSRQHFTSLTLGSDGRPYVGTGVEGQVYTVDLLHQSQLMADTEERQVSALILSGAKQYVISSDAAVVHPIRGIGGAEAVWTSKVLDAGIRANFGKMTWDAQGTLELSTRSGNTKEPDDTWSAWSAPLAAGGDVKSPGARYLQVRARFSKDASAVLREVEIPFVTDNLRAVITSVNSDSSAKPGGSSDGVEKSGEPITRSADTKIKLTWKVDNPDRDELRYRLEYRMEGTTDWLSVLEPQEVLTKDSYSWETKDLPEGRYRVRITASDELSNPPAQVKRHNLSSNLVYVDNTPPTIEGLEGKGRRITGRVIDGIGPIERIEVARAGTNQWYPLSPSDGIFDESREEFDADVSSVLGTAPALLTVRAFDRSANSVVRSIFLK